MPPEAAKSSKNPSHPTEFEKDKEEHRLLIKRRKPAPVYEFLTELVN
jgi:hypothetical protein